MHYDSLDWTAEIKFGLRPEFDFNFELIFGLSSKFFLRV